MIAGRANFKLLVAGVLAAFLFAGAVGKAWNPGPTVRVLSMHWHVASPATIGVVWALVAVEIVIAVWLLWTGGGRAALLGSSLFLLAVSISPMLQWLRHDTSSCGCGLPDPGGDPWMAVFGRNLPLAAAALGAAWPVRKNVSRLAEMQREEQ